MQTTYQLDRRIIQTQKETREKSVGDEFTRRKAAADEIEARNRATETC